MQLHVGRPIWLAGKPSRRRYPSLSGSHDADVVIIGGGMTGASIAQVFAEAGVSVALVEAGLVGRGSTSVSTALLMQDTDDTLGELERRYGRSGSRRIWELSYEGTRDLVHTLRRLHIPVTDRDAIHFTTARKAALALRKESERRRRAGFGASWMTPAALLRATGIAGAGAIRSKGNGQCDPYRACIGLLRSAAQHGARVFERSRAARIDMTGGGVIVRTPRGTISAMTVIIATGYAMPEFKPLAARFRMKHTYVLATRRISRRERHALGLGDVLLWDTARQYHYARWTDDHRLLLGGEDRPVVSPAHRRVAFAEGTARLRAHFEHLLPALKDIAIERAWEGLFAMTPDGLPYIGRHRRYPGHLFALGYGGNGMTFGFLAARLLLDAFRGIANPDLELFAFDRLRRRR